ncbi:hypothetical protein [Paraburkholderia sp. BCC1876]|uniref:NMCC_0638 family (lipo)protein n=1 Tax=Paraburkholderia sp. BCC1876 TaxID=2676303 RepID=UPI0015920F23|nr:hypothetical protein [Paraburkholderia sp. BCC1876]
MRNQIRKLVLVLGVTSALASHHALAADPAAGFLVGLFMKVCVPNMGRPSGVEAWADGWHLHEITDAIPLQVFVGDGENGKAWAVPAKYGSFALSIRGTTRACAVWARAADPGEVEADFHKLIDGSKRPGLNLTVVEDKILPSPAGPLHELVYQMSATDAATGFVFTLLTAENPGGAFQASLQVAAARIPSPTN